MKTFSGQELQSFELYSSVCLVLGIPNFSLSFDEVYSWHFTSQVSLVVCFHLLMLSHPFWYLSLLMF